MNYIVLLLLSLGLYSVSNKINQKFFHDKDNVIINTFIFTFFFSLIYLINSYLFILNINNGYVSYLVLSLIIIVTLLQWKEFKNYFEILKSELISKNKFLFLIIFFYFLIILFPVSDEDSLRYHLEIAKKINLGTFYENTWFDYIAIGAHEFINSFSIRLNFDHISSYSNFLYLVFAIISNVYILKKYKEGSGILSCLILLSSPYLISLVSSQKFYFLPCFVVSYSIVYLFLEKKISDISKYLILLLNIFCVIIKPTFFPYLILVAFLLFYKCNGYKNKILYLIYGMSLAIIFYYPIFFIKLKIYNDPFLPYISLNSQNSEWLTDYNYYLTSFNMDFTDEIKNLYIKYLLIPIKLIFPLRVSDIFKTLGLGILFIFSFDYKKNNYLFFLLLFFIFVVVLLNNFQSRWFLPLLIFVSIFARIDKSIILRKLIWLQLLGISCVLIPMGFTILAQNIGIIDKKVVLDKVFQSHKIIDYINNKYENEKIFSRLNYFYYFDNVVPVYHYKIVKKFDENYYTNNEKTTKLILWPVISPPTVTEFINENFTCKKIKKIEEFSVGIGRFFLNHKKNKTKFVLYKLDC